MHSNHIFIIIVVAIETFLDQSMKLNMLKIRSKITHKYYSYNIYQCTVHISFSFHLINCMIHIVYDYTDVYNLVICQHCSDL